MIYHPVSTLILAGIKKLKIVSTGEGISQFKNLLGNGESLGIFIDYATQDMPLGIVDAMRAGLKNENLSAGACVILGDNIFFGTGMGRGLGENYDFTKAKIFLKQVANPSHFGIAEFDSKGSITDLIEKPKNISSNFAVTGLYFFPPDLAKRCEQVVKSSRNEFEIISLLKLYLNDSNLDHELLGRGTYWADAGTTESLFEISTLIKLVQTQLGMLVGSPEEASFLVKNISVTQFNQLIDKMPMSSYKEALSRIVQ